MAAALHYAAATFLPLRTCSVSMGSPRGTLLWCSPLPCCRASQCSWPNGADQVDDAVLTEHAVGDDGESLM